MKELPVSKGRATAYVSDDDWPLVSQYTWHLMPGGYARTKIPKSQGGGLVMLHRMIMGATQKGQYVDHIDDNGLNCQRENLQFITQSRNIMKSRRVKATTGVYQHYSGRWYGRFKADKRNIFVGSFETQQEAIDAVAKARDEAWNGTLNPDRYERGLTPDQIFAGRDTIVRRQTIDECAQYIRDWGRGFHTPGQLADMLLSLKEDKQAKAA